ncbi:hypothetical protein ACHQM5_025425 [Ranunculus cassubicifolius]
MGGGAGMRRRRGGERREKFVVRIRVPYLTPLSGLLGPLGWVWAWWVLAWALSLYEDSPYPMARVFAKEWNAFGHAEERHSLEHAKERHALGHAKERHAKEQHAEEQLRSRSSILAWFGRWSCEEVPVVMCVLLEMTALDALWFTFHCIWVVLPIDIREGILGGVMLDMA